MKSTAKIALALTLIIISAAALTSCGKKAETAGGTTSDSLLAGSPIEQPQGAVTPNGGFNPDPAGAQAPAPAAQPGNTPAPRSERPASKPEHKTPKATPPAPAEPSVTVPAGTALKVSIDTPVSSETAHQGDSWTGSIKEAVTVGSLAPFPAGSIVHGVVEGVAPAEKGSRAVLVLRIDSIEANGKTLSVDAGADSIVAGSTRARNLGAIAGSAAAGALIGKAIGGSGKGALIGGILGGAAATGAVAKSKGYQADVAKGAEMLFHVRRDTHLKL
jgi:hypothetical protein